jgi:hypothetical protein
MPPAFAPPNAMLAPAAMAPTSLGVPRVWLRCSRALPAGDATS